MLLLGKLTGPKIGRRVIAEAESNQSINVSTTAGQDAFEVEGRGELQLGSSGKLCFDQMFVRVLKGLTK